MDFIVSEEVEDLIEVIQGRHPARFQHIEPERLLSAFEISGHRVKHAVKVFAVRPPFHLLNPKIVYIVCAYRFRWEDLSPQEKERAVMRELCKIPIEFDGSLSIIPIKDFPEVLIEYGVPEFGLVVKEEK